MSAQDDQVFSQGRRLQDRVEREISDKTGHLEDQSLDLDARTMAILGKRQQLSVRSHDPRTVPSRLLTVSCLQRNFGVVSLVAFSTTLIASWESIAL